MLDDNKIFLSHVWHPWNKHFVALGGTYGALLWLGCVHSSSAACPPTALSVARPISIRNPALNFLTSFFFFLINSFIPKLLLLTYMEIWGSRRFNLKWLWISDDHRMQKLDLHIGCSLPYCGVPGLARTIRDYVLKR